MSLGIAFKGPEGIVLAADSRVTLNAKLPDQNLLLPSTFDNATKLLRVYGQDYVGAVTYGLGALGEQEPRTAHSFIPEFEEELSAAGVERLTVEDFAQRLGDFFHRQWDTLMPPDYAGPDMVFIVGGYDKGAAYGKVFDLKVPSNPAPIEKNPGPMFGIVWGGQREFTDRLIQGFDSRLPDIAQKFLNISDARKSELEQHLKQNFSVRIPYQFLPLQDCVDLSIFLLRTTITIQTWLVDIRGVGGAIDVATITRTDGFQPVQTKKITGE